MEDVRKEIKVGRKAEEGENEGGTKTQVWNECRKEEINKNGKKAEIRKGRTRRELEPRNGGETDAWKGSKNETSKEVIENSTNAFVK